jgi:hypothetical protein
VAGVFDAVRTEFSALSNGPLLEQVEAIYEFRNSRVAHVNIELTDREVAERGLRQWVEGLVAIQTELAGEPVPA